MAVKMKDNKYIDHKCKLAFELYTYLMPIEDSGENQNCIRILYNAEHCMNNDNQRAVCLYKLFLSGMWEEFVKGRELMPTYTNFAKELLDERTNR